MYIIVYLDCIKKTEKVTKYSCITCFYGYILLKYTLIKHEKYYFFSYQVKHTALRFTKQNRCIFPPIKKQSKMYSLMATWIRQGSVFPLEVSIKN